MAPPSLSEVRVRFAPSPTGYLHVGGLRTALYNYLFARRAGGAFILRIEDTDRSRYVDGAVENLLETLRWAGLSWDEGPVAGGGAGPYVQSERRELYAAAAAELLASGRAYRCFCTQEDLAASRSDAQMYDRRCRALPAAEASRRFADCVPCTVRLAVPRTGATAFTDLIRGEVRVEHERIDDQVLLKSDGFPTYHLANVVDDHAMRISHVIRGEEWLLSTPKHLLLYEAFGWTPPRFAHLPLLLNPDRSKLSKRQGDVAVEDYRAKGYLAPALVNFIALLGWNPGTDRECFTLDELVEAFSLDRVGVSGAVFDTDKLAWFNGQYLRALDPAALATLCRPVLDARGMTIADPDLLQLATALQAQLRLPSDILDRARFFFAAGVVPSNDEAAAALAAPAAASVLRCFADRCEALDPWNRDTVKAAMKETQKDTGITGKEFFQPVRAALTGELHGPDLPVIAGLLGRDRTVQRLREALQSV